MPCRALPFLGSPFPSHSFCCTNTLKEKSRGNLCLSHYGWSWTFSTFYAPCVSAAASLAEQTSRSCIQGAYPESSLLHLCCLLPFTSFNSKGRNTFYPITTNWLRTFFFPRSMRENSFKSKNLKLTITWSETTVKTAILINEIKKTLDWLHIQILILTV